ncbi:unnamed protein product [Nippostrongylus brasiliensis]|uniref:Ovule protein n=1 Tax=Nippostrongylus brasiliensis TaxID=27835 RepID=A0A0N4Y8U2_NIPBR|nr:unnamed protein product [Nippostrongylus brasiliensis]
MLTDYYASMDSDVHSLSTEIQALKSMLFMLEKEYILKKTTIEAEMGAALYIQKEAVESIRNNGLHNEEDFKEWFRNMNHHPEEDSDEGEQDGEEYDAHN